MSFKENFKELINRWYIKYPLTAAVIILFLAFAYLVYILKFGGA